MQTPFDWTLVTFAAAPPSAGPAPTVNPADALRGTTGTAAANGATGALPAQNQQQQGIPTLFWMLPLFLFLMIGMQVLAGRKERKKRESLLSALKKNDRVLTIGGLIGTVADVRDDEVSLRIDENSAVKVRVTRSAIQQILRSGDGSSEPTPSVEVKSRGDRVTA